MEECNEILLDVLNQCCGDGNGEIDNQCISAYEYACDYLKKKGLLEEVNSRIFNIIDFAEYSDIKNIIQDCNTCKYTQCLRKSRGWKGCEDWKKQS